MLEIETKYVLDDPAALVQRLVELGAKPVEERTDADHYFNAPDRDFAVTGEAFRIRRIGERNLITWKGPKFDKDTKSREEIEIPFAAGDESASDLSRLLQRLGYRPVAIVTKQRRVFEFERGGFQVQFCVDEVAEVGTFAEVEIVAEPERFEAAKALVLSCAAELGLTQMERRSYLGMLLASRAT